MRDKQRQRGQVLPIWILGILGTFALIFTALNYGNSLRWHIRAQSAADAATQATLALQSERWNEMTELLYGMNVEEYRIRTLLNGILLASTLSGGCYQTDSTTQGSAEANTMRDCEAAYDILTPQYLKAVQRYSQEAASLHKVAVNASYSKWLQDANALMTELTQNCNSTNVAVTAVNVGGGDCAFSYKFVVTMPTYRSQANTGVGLSTVREDGNSVTIPSYGTSATVDTEDPQLFAPVQVDVVTCANVPPIIPNFFKMNTPSYQAIGRSAATNVLFVQDWFQPGQLRNPLRTAAAGYDVLFQPVENYGTPAAPSGQRDFYAVDFGGNATVDNESTGSYSSLVANPEFSVHLGWWNSIPVRPTTQISNNLFSTCGQGTGHATTP